MRCFPGGQSETHMFSCSVLRQLAQRQGLPMGAGQAAGNFQNRLAIMTTFVGAQAINTMLD